MHLTLKEFYTETGTFNSSREFKHKVYYFKGRPIEPPVNQRGKDENFITMTEESNKSNNLVEKSYTTQKSYMNKDFPPPVPLISYQ